MGKIIVDVEEFQKLKDEVWFLKERNKDLRQKTYINVYDENLKLIDEIKMLKIENERKFNNLVKYERTIEQLRKELIQVGQVADDFHKDAVRINNENKHLKEVIESVQTFIGQFAK
jgi:chromosome condensin MukBEF MukE localization factor